MCAAATLPAINAYPTTQKALSTANFAEATSDRTKQEGFKREAQATLPGEAMKNAKLFICLSMILIPFTPVAPKPLRTLYYGPMSSIR